MVGNITRMSERDMISNLLDLDFSITEAVHKQKASDYIRVKKKWDKVSEARRKKANRKQIL